MESVLFPKLRSPSTSISRREAWMVLELRRTVSWQFRNLYCCSVYFGISIRIHVRVESMTPISISIHVTGTMVDSPAGPYCRSAVWSSVGIVLDHTARSIVAIYVLVHFEFLSLGFPHFSHRINIEDMRVSMAGPFPAGQWSREDWTLLRHDFI